MLLCIWVERGCSSRCSLLTAIGSADILECSFATACELIVERLSMCNEISNKNRRETLDQSRGFGFAESGRLEPLLCGPYRALPRIKTRPRTRAKSWRTPYPLRVTRLLRGAVRSNGYPIMVQDRSRRISTFLQKVTFLPSSDGNDNDGAA